MKGESKEYILFGNKSISNLFQEVYNNQQSKKTHIQTLIADFKDKIKSSSDVAEIGPVIKDLVKFSVENDEILLKLASLAQRIVAAESKSTGDDGFLTEVERLQLLEELEITANKIDSKEVNSRVMEIESELEYLQDKLSK